MAISPPLSVGWGYGIVLGLGALFAFGMVHFHSPKKLRNLTSTVGPRHVDPQTLQ
jgi:hypothetical protein